MEWSPRTRGWSHRAQCAQRRLGVVPAHAGVVPAMDIVAVSWGVVPAHAGVVPRGDGPPARGARGPRARGGGPAHSAGGTDAARWSPRTRGWSRWRAGRDGEVWSPRTRGWSRLATSSTAARTVVPAHAGVVPARQEHWREVASGPRARGGGPGNRNPRIRRGQWSPRTRGWSRPRRPPVTHLRVVPAHAGVVPRTSRPRRPFSCGPRARGGGPPSPAPLPQTVVVVPAHAGVVLGVAFRGRRARTGGPRAHGGLSLRCGFGVLVAGVVPAHAGVVPPKSPTPGASACGPRARGGGPGGSRGTSRTGLWSPRTRGWSLAVGRLGGELAVVPAHAGVVP